MSLYREIEVRQYAYEADSLTYAHWWEQANTQVMNPVVIWMKIFLCTDTLEAHCVIMFSLFFEWDDKWNEITKALNYKQDKGILNWDWLLAAEKI